MNNTNICPCSSNELLVNCCLPYIKGEIIVPSAEKLMRSRYTAYSLHDAEYLYNTTHVSERKYTNKKDILAWAKQNVWQKLEVINFSENSVEFKAFFFDSMGKSNVHHEKSTFIKFQDNWFYVDGKFF